MTDSKVKQATDKAHYLDAETRKTLGAVKSKGNKAVGWFVACFLILFVLGVASYVRINQSITRQNQISIISQKHIDCIVKLFTVPLPTGARSRTLTNPSTTCNINFTQ